MASAGTSRHSSTTDHTPAAVLVPTDVPTEAPVRAAARPGPTSGHRRRQRSTRLVVAVVLVCLAVLAVVGSALPGSWLLAVVGGAAAAVLGGVAARVTYAEVVTTRREAAADRARQAQGYRALTDERTAEQSAFSVEMQGRVARRDATIGRLEKRLGETADELAGTRASLADAQAELVLAQGELARVLVDLEETTGRTDQLALALATAEDRAAQAVIRVADLEQELDVMTSQLQAGLHMRKHA